MSAETSLSISKVQLDPDTKRIKEYTPPKWPKPVSYILSALTALSIAYGTKKSSAENTNTNLNNTQLGEFITWSNYESGIPAIEKMKYLNKIESDSFFIIRLPLKRSGNKDTYATDESDKRANYYLLSPPNSHNLIPQFCFNGKSENVFNGTPDDQLQALINFTKENPQQQGKFSIKEVKRNKEFEIEFLTNEKKLLNSNDYSFTVIAYEDWVNVNAENGERTYRNVFIESPLTATGMATKISKDGLASRTVTFNKITEKNRKQAGFVVFMQNKNIQDKNAKQIIATGLCRFAELDNQKYPIKGNWNNRPSVSYDYQNKTEFPETLEKTGLQKMDLYLENLNGKNLKEIKFNIFQNDWDDDWYEVLAGQLNPELKGKAEFKFDPKDKSVTVTFKEAFNPSEKTKIFTLFEHLKKVDRETSYGQKISNISMKDDKGNLIYADWSDIDLTRAAPDQRNNIPNPTDLDSDTWVGPKDEQIIMDEFGKMKGDKDWTGETEKCDLNKDERIDTTDLAEFELAKDGRVDNYKRAKIVFETNPGSLPTEIQREIEQDLKKLKTEILRAQIDQAYQQMKAE